MERNKNPNHKPETPSKKVDGTPPRVPLEVITKAQEAPSEKKGKAKPKAKKSALSKKTTPKKAEKPAVIEKKMPKKLETVSTEKDTTTTETAAEAPINSEDDQGKSEGAVLETTKNEDLGQDGELDEAVVPETIEEAEKDLFEGVILLRETHDEEGELLLREVEAQEAPDTEVGDGKDQDPEQPTEDTSAEQVDEDALSLDSTAPQPVAAPTPPVIIPPRPGSSAKESAAPVIPSAPFAPGGSGGGGAQLPPHHLAAANQQPPHGGGGGPAAANLAPNLPPLAVPERTPNRNRTAERRNLVAGILLGGVIEHIRHKRREKRTKAKYEKEITKLKKEQKFQEAKQLKNEQKSKRTKTTLEAQIERLNQDKHPQPKDKHPSKVKQETPKLQAAQPELVSQASQEAIKPAPAPSAFYEEFKQKYRTPETIATTPLSHQELRNKPEKPAAVPKQQPENVDELVEIPADRRVETSAWHRIEVDKKTGEAVQDPTLAYGEEFQNEQHQEQLRRQIDEASMETETVKQNYMPIIDKTASTRVEMHNTAPTSKQPSQKQNNTTAASLGDKLQTIRDKAGDTNSVDIVLWVVLFLIIVTIIGLL